MSVFTDIDNAVIDLVLKRIEGSIRNGVSCKVLQRFGMVETFALPEVIALERIMGAKFCSISQVGSKVIAIGIENLPDVTTFVIGWSVGGQVWIRAGRKPAAKTNSMESGLAVPLDDFNN